MSLENEIIEFLKSSSSSSSNFENDFTNADYQELNTNYLDEDTKTQTLEKSINDDGIFKEQDSNENQESSFQYQEEIEDRGLFNLSNDVIPATSNLKKTEKRIYSELKNAAKTFYIIIVKYLKIALDSGELLFNNPEKYKIKEYLLSRSTSKCANNSPKWNMETLLLKSTNVAFEGFDINTSNMIKEKFYNYIKKKILKRKLWKFFRNNSKTHGDKKVIFNHYCREILIPSTMRRSKKNKVNQNDLRTCESKTTRCSCEQMINHLSIILGFNQLRI